MTIIKINRVHYKTYYGLDLEGYLTKTMRRISLPNEWAFRRVTVTWMAPWSYIYV